MADIDKFVDSDVAAGGAGTSGDPYDTLVTAVNHMESNLTAGQTGLIYCRGSADDITDAMAMDAFATGADITVQIRPWDDFGTSDDGEYIGNLSWHSDFYIVDSGTGMSANTAIFDLTDTNGNVIFDIDGIQIWERDTGQVFFGIAVENGNQVILNNVRLRGPNDASFNRGIRTDGGSSGLAVKATNCIFFDWNSAFNGNTAEDVTFINCAFHDNDQGTAAKGRLIVAPAITSA